MIGDSADENNFTYWLLRTDRQVSKLRKAFASNSLANIKLPKTQLSEIVQSAQFFDRLPRTLAKNVFILLELSAAVSITDAATWQLRKNIDHFKQRNGRYYENS